MADRKPDSELSPAGRRYRMMREAAIAGGYVPQPREKKYETEEERAAARRGYSQKYRTSEKGRESSKTRRISQASDARAYRLAKAQGLI